MISLAVSTGLNVLLVITSALRPKSRQPANSTDRSVHPAGMAIDLRKPSGKCLTWLRSTLVALEEKGVVEAMAQGAVAGYPVDVQPRTTDQVRPMNMYGASKCFGEATAAWAIDTGMSMPGLEHTSIGGDIPTFDDDTLTIEPTSVATPSADFRAANAPEAEAEAEDVDHRSCPA